eukprot:6208781-Pleurochrysis_carterae.AAC.1
MGACQPAGIVTILLKQRGRRGCSQSSSPYTLVRVCARAEASEKKQGKVGGSRRNMGRVRASEPKGGNWEESTVGTGKG